MRCNTREHARHARVGRAKHTDVFQDDRAPDGRAVGIFVFSVYESSTVLRRTVLNVVSTERLKMHAKRTKRGRTNERNEKREDPFASQNNPTSTPIVCEFFRFI